MRKKRIRLRALPLVLSASMVMSALSPSVCFAADGYTEFAFPNLDNLREFSFGDYAQTLSYKYGITPTGLALNYTSTHRKVAGALKEEPQWYGKWWVSVKKEERNPVYVSGEPGKLTYIDFSKLGYQFTSCIQNHRGDSNGNVISGNGLRGTRVDLMGTQFFASEAYYPGTNPANYPTYIQNAHGDINTMKFYLILMCGLHSFKPSDIGLDNETAMKDDTMATVYSMLQFCYTLSLEDSNIASQIHTADEIYANMKNMYAEHFALSYGPNQTGTNFYEELFGSKSDGIKRWFARQWNDAMFMSQFNYTLVPSDKGDGSYNMAVQIPFTDPALGADGKYHVYWDYSEFTKKYNAISQDKNANLTAKFNGNSTAIVANQNNILDVAAPTLDALNAALADCVFTIGASEGEGGVGNAIQPAGLIGGRFVSVYTDASGKPQDMVNDGQLRFLSYSQEVALVPSLGKPKDKPKPNEQKIVRYKHTEQFTADYNVRLKKYDSETGQPLENSHWDVLEAFPDADGQLGQTSLEEESNWQNNEGSQFMKWDGWDYSEEGNPDGDAKNDPCKDDDNKTNENGELSYDDGSIAHKDVKSYTYIKGFCGGHPAKPEEKIDPETGEVTNQDEIDAWEKEVETCQELIDESSTGYYCATAENGYEDGEDEDGAKSKKEMEDDRDARYKEFIGLEYKYSAKELTARPGYILHDEHTDDIPLEEKVVTSSQEKEFNGTYGGDATKLPHKGGSGAAGGGEEGGDDPADEGGSIRRAARAVAAANTETSSSETEETTLEGTSSENDYVNFLNGIPEEDTVEDEAKDEVKDDVKDERDADANTEDADRKTDTETESKAETETKTEANVEKKTEENTEADTNTESMETNATEGDENADADADTLPNEDEDVDSLSLSDENEDVDSLSVEDEEDTEDSDSLSMENEENTAADDDAEDEDAEDLATDSELDKEDEAETEEVDSESISAEKRSWMESLYEKVQEIRTKFYETLTGAWTNFVSLLSNDEDDRSGAAHPVRDSVTWTPDGPGNYVDPLKNDIVDHTFTVFDHRTEGEIHINKRDLDLEGKTGDSYDAYGDTNGDGSLEGAVYGLFAADDIEHPDGHTSTVYKKDDIVAVATTDRNGDASFMTFTEAPGMTYNYETGRIEKRTDENFDGPDNLHKSEADGDAVAEDNERYEGHDKNNNTVTIDDSKAGDDTVYYKHSSNQEGIEGLTGTNTTYPILNNEKNNGNCWIGRPLIVGANGTHYYVKELSRSEGYELSVTGKANEITNGKDSYNVTSSNMKVNIGSTKIKAQWKELPVTATNVDRDVQLSVTAPKDVTFSTITQKTETYHTKEYTTVPVEKPVIGTKGERVKLDGKYVEAALGGSVTVGGKAYEITSDRVSAPEQATTGAVPANKDVRDIVNKDTVGATNKTEFMEKFNAELLKNKFKTPVANAPWFRVELPGASDTDWINAVNSEMTKRGILFFNAARITDIVEEGGKSYAVIRYDHATGNDVDSCVYNTTKEVLYIKKETPSNGSFIYVEVPLSSTLVVSTNRNESGFITSAAVKSFTTDCNVTYPAALPTSFTLNVVKPKTYFVYDGTMQRFNDDGSLATWTDYTQEVKDVEKTRVVDVETPLNSTYENGKYSVTIPKSLFDGNDTVNVAAKGGMVLYNTLTVIWNPATEDDDSYIVNRTLTYKNQNEIRESDGTETTPQAVTERSIRQKVKVSKDIETMKETKTVWYCINCGYENADGVDTCEHCGHPRTTEETKTIKYAHDTYSAVHSENLSAKREAGLYDTVKDWLTKLMNGEEEATKQESATDIPNFRFKAYLKSNLERLYRTKDGTVTWMDRNGNLMTPEYKDTNGDGNYDTFTWKYNEAYNKKTVDFPEKDKVLNDTNTESANVQKIYTDVPHEEDSKTNSSRANNVWATYRDPQNGNGTDAGEKEGFTTSERTTADGHAGDASGNAIDSAASLYHYAGKNEDVDKSDRIYDSDNTGDGSTRILEMTKKTIEDGHDTREVETYNYEKFFDALNAANTDVWDNDMHSTFTGNAMKNYPGQHWFETFYEKYQKDDTDDDHTLANTDGADKDNTAGGDRDTSFKPFRWIREHVFGNRADYEKYKAEHNGVNTEVESSTSKYAKANAEASDAVRQFAVKWYLKDEAAKIMKNNGNDENIAADNNGTITYDEEVYDKALFEAIAKSYNYLKPFYTYDLDTIYSVEWDSAENGGSDSDYTTLSVDHDDGDTHSAASAYLPYGTYVIVEQQPQRRDGSVNDWENRSYEIEKPKEVIVPSLYDAASSNDTTDNYDTHYNYNEAMTTENQAKKDNYLIRFGEEWSDNAPNNGQDERQYVIRAHNFHGDFEVYKYGLDIDRVNSLNKAAAETIDYAGGSYAYKGWKYTQSVHDPIKDYYDTEHHGEAGIDTIGTENGGNDASDYMAIDSTNGQPTANGTTYDGKPLQDRFFYAGISEDKGTADNVMYKGTVTDDNNKSGMFFKDSVPSMTGQQTAYSGKYASMLVPWTVTEHANSEQYDASTFSGYADVNERNGFFTTFLRINKTDSETGEYILHDDAIFALYAGSRYQSFDEIKEDAKLIKDTAEREKFLKQFKPGDAKFYLQDTEITGTMEFLKAMKATEITAAARGRSVVESGAGAGELYTGIVKKGTPVCLESEKIMLTDELGARTGQMTVYTTLNDVEVTKEDNDHAKEYVNQNTGYFVTPQPIGAGVYVLAEIKAPSGYARSNPVAYEVYSDKTSYYVDGDMYSKVSAVRYNGNLLTDINYKN